MNAFFNNLFGKKNVTCEWHEKTGDITCELSHPSICGVRIGESIEHLSHFGPCDDLSQTANLGYKKYGLGLIQNDNVLEDVDFDISSENINVKFTYLGEPVIINQETDVDTVVEIFGEGLEKLTEDNEVTLRYDVNNNLLEFYWEEGKLDYVTFCELTEL